LIATLALAVAVLIPLALALAVAALASERSLSLTPVLSSGTSEKIRDREHSISPSNLPSAGPGPSGPLNNKKNSGQL
jgi:hypothetical protein